MMEDLKNKFLNQLQIISNLEMMQHMTTFLYGEDALLLKLFLKEATNPKQMSKALNITKGRVTAIVNSLVKKDYLITLPNPLDGRSIDLSLSNDGLSYIKERLDFMDSYFKDLLTHIGLDTSNMLVDILDKVLIEIEDYEAKHNG